MKTKLMIITMMLAGMLLAEGPEGGFNRQAPGPMGGLFPAMRGSDPIVRIVSNPKTAAEAGISKDQIANIQKINKELREQEKPLREKAKKINERENELLMSDKPDEAAVMAAIDELFDARREMAKLQAGKSIRIKALLTAEQLEKAKQLAERQREDLKNRFKNSRSGKNRKASGGNKSQEPGNPPPPPPEE